MTGRQRVIRDALPSEASALSALALRSKGLWPYSEAFLAACKGELTFSTAQINDARTIFRAVEENGVVSAFVALDLLADGEAELLALFVDPPCVRRGLGEALWADAVAIARGRGVGTVLIASDPYAEPFYARMGACTTGEIASGSIRGRRLPLMRYEVPDVSAKPL